MPDRLRTTKTGDPDGQTLLEHIRKQWCWWCDTGPWRVLALHTSRHHGVTAWELRDMAGLVSGDSITSPEHRKFCQRRLVDRPMSHPKGLKYKTKRYTTAGMQSQLAKLKKIWRDPQIQQKRVTQRALNKQRNGHVVSIPEV